jgi:hypothetical protein
MGNWKSSLNKDPTDWLLEDTNPSVRYFTLKWIFDLKDDDSKLTAASQAVSQSTPVKKLLSRQRPEGYWGSDTRPHHGTKRFLGILKWLGYRGNDGIKPAMDYLINGVLQEDGAYAIELKDRMVELPCHAGDLLSLMFWAGYEEDPRARKLLDWVVGIQGDDGIWPCVSKLKPFSCLWATVDILRAYRDLPTNWITPKIKASKDLAIQQILNTNLYKYGKGKISSRWFEFGFPLRFDTDILEVLELLGPYVSPDAEQIQEGLSLVLEKQQANGRWLCEKHPKGGRWMKQFIEFEEIGQPSKWVTLHSMKMLKTLFKNGS